MHYCYVRLRNQSEPTYGDRILCHNVGIDNAISARDGMSCVWKDDGGSQAASMQGVVVLRLCARISIRQQHSRRSTRLPEVPRPVQHWAWRTSTSQTLVLFQVLCWIITELLWDTLSCPTPWTILSVIIHPQVNKVLPPAQGVHATGKEHNAHT